MFKEKRRMLGNLADAVIRTGFTRRGVPVEGTVVVMAKNLFDVGDFTRTMRDGVSELLGRGVSLQLVSATVGDPNNAGRGVVGAAVYLEHRLTALCNVSASETAYKVTFFCEEAHGIPGALIVKNHHRTSFFLKTLTLENFPGKGRVHFVCNSWIYPVAKCRNDRIFFANDPYLPGNTPEPLRGYREDELNHLRGDNITTQLQKWDRVYNYAYYNDLGDPDLSMDLARPVLGGSQERPYPRRCKTGRPPARRDVLSESRTEEEIYIPRDELFSRTKKSSFLGSGLKALSTSVFSTLKSFFTMTPVEFKTLKDVFNLFEGGVPIPQGVFIILANAIPSILIKEIIRPDGSRLLKYPVPHIIQEDKWAWRTDVEFGRQMLAGVNPVTICRLKEFPPTSTLDPLEYGKQNSTITVEHIQKHLEGLTMEQALDEKRLFILDYHDILMPYLRDINSTASKVYASRTLFLLREDQTLKPIAIELSLPHPSGDQYGALSNVYTPAEFGVDASVWQLAKTYVSSNDYGVHQLISHWLHTHAVIEPFVIATNRQLSVMHPIHKLLSPHFRDTMNINSMARQSLINAGGLIESIMFTGKYSMDITSKAYKSWNFLEQALPQDLLKRGMAEEDEESPHGVKLVISDYPYAADGLAIWGAIKDWVRDYTSIYYTSDDVVCSDTELQAWWREVREVGHCDKKASPWWPNMDTISNLVHTCTIIIWISSALHAAVNFGQYPYAGYPLNRPPTTRRHIPEPHNPEFSKLVKNPDRFLLKTVAGGLQTIMGITLVKILSTHSAEEVYIGHRDSAEWTSDRRAMAAFQRLWTAVEGIKQRIDEMNGDQRLKNRRGPANMPYNLLYPSSTPGITAMGIPNSISI